MKFFGTPNQLVKEKRRKPYSRDIVFVPIFRFDKNGEYVTDNERLIEKLKRKFKYENNVPGDKPTDIRAMAKEKGIRNWHNMKIENLIEKLKEE